MENASGYIEDVFEQLKEINQYYKISNLETEDYLKTANKAYVLIAGKEGSDKGGFCNDLFLGYRRNILEEKNISGEDITTIIEYGDEDSVEVYRGNIKERYTLDEYTKTDEAVEYIKVYLNNTKLCEFEKLDLKSKINSILEIPVLMGAIFSGFGYVYMKAREKERKEKIKVKLEKEIFFNIAEEICVNVREKIVNENIIKGAEKIIDDKIKSIKENINQLEKIKGSEEEYKNKKTEELKENIKALEGNIKKLN